METDKTISSLSSEGASLAKVIATFSVVLTHSYKLFMYLGVQESEVIYLRGFHAFASCGVPVFFFLSGYFLVYKDNWNYCKNLKKKFISLVIPYVVFMLLYTTISCIGAFVLPKFFDDFRTFNLSDWILHVFGIPFVKVPNYYGPLWFIRELMIFNVFSIILVPIVKKIPGYVLVPLAVVLYFLPIPWLIRFSIPFFIVGMYFGFKKKIPVFTSTVNILVLFVLAFILPIVFEGEVSWRISVLLMAIFIVVVSEKLIEKQRFKKVTRIAMPFSFSVYLLHEYPMTSLMRLLAIKHIPVQLAVFAFFLVPFIIIIVCVFVILAWKRLLPKTYALFTGGR